MLDLIMDTFKVSEEEALAFLVKYEINVSLNEDYDYGELYKVDVFLNEEGLNEGLMNNLIAEGEREDRAFAQISDNHAVLFIEVNEHSEDGVYDIEEMFGTFLQGGKLGDYFWKCLI